MPREEWNDIVLDNGEMLGQYYDAAVPDDTFGWGNLYRKMWFSDYSHRPSGTGVLLTGPEGCGKHTAAAHLIRELRNRDYWVGLLPEDDAGGEGPNTPTRDRLNGLLDLCSDEGKGLCLLVEDLDRRSRSRELGQFLGEMLCLYTLRRGADSQTAGPKDRVSGRSLHSGDDPLAPFFLILIQNKEQSVPSLLRSRLQLCRMSPPDRDHRVLFFVNHPAACLRGESALVTQEELLERTEGLSYAQLEDLVNSLNALSLADKRADKRAFLALAEAQRPQVRGGGLSARMEKLLAELPKVLSNLQLGGGTAVQTPPDPPPEEPDSQEAMRKQFEKDSVYKSSVDIFGEDWTEAFIAEKKLTVVRR